MSSDSREVAAFYDEFSKRLLRDYVVGNARFEAALAFVAAAVDERVGAILDLGCGIGASSARMASLREGVRVTGLDLSPENIRTASALFADEPGVSYVVGDISELSNDLGPVDLVTMVDSLEHLPRGLWPKVMASIDRVLGPEGVVAITLPSPLHQQYLAEHDPAGLQVVDETVTLTDLGLFADHLGATITHFAMVTVWRTNDYVHVRLERAPRYEKPPRTRPSWTQSVGRAAAKWSARGEVAARAKRVKDVLGVEVSE